MKKTAIRFPEFYRKIVFLWNTQLSFTRSYVRLSLPSLSSVGSWWQGCCQYWWTVFEPRVQETGNIQKLLDVEIPLCLSAAFFFQLWGKCPTSFLHSAVALDTLSSWSAFSERNKKKTRLCWLKFEWLRNMSITLQLQLPLSPSPTPGSQEPMGDLI